MAKTNIGLVEFVLSTLGSAYLYGCQGQLVTERLIQAKARQYPLIFTPSYIERSRVGIGKIGYDCSALIDCYTGYDKSANDWFAVATIKGEGIATMPDKKGTLVHFDGHVGVYIGNGEVVEARGADYGVVLTKLKDRPWKRWSQCPYIEYVEDVIIAPEKFTLTKLLRRGMTGEVVKSVQRIVGVKDDGFFGNLTEKAVKDWQTKHFLTADGIVGPATCTAMGGIWAPVIVVPPAPVRPVNPYAMPTYTLHRGRSRMARKDVKWLQFELNWRYGKAVVVDGSFGPITDTWLRNFQKNVGLSVDGQCGPLTKDKLKGTGK